MKALIALIAMGFAMTTVSFANDPAPATTETHEAAKKDEHAAPAGEHHDAPAATAKAKKKKAAH